MGNTAKVLLGLLAMFLVICGIAGYIGVRKAKAGYGRLVDQAQQEGNAARQWAVGHQQTDCLDEAMRRSLACRDTTCQIGTSMFSSVCLDSANPTPGLCDGVPQQRQFSASLQWQNQRCGAMPPLDAQSCRNVANALQQHCAMREMRVMRSDASVPR